MNTENNSRAGSLSARLGAVLPRVMLVVAGLALLASSAAAQLRERQRLVSSDRNRDDQFGYGLAILGDLAVCGSPLDDDHGADSGSVYCFRQQGGIWQEQVPKIYASDAAARDEFGYSVATTGDVIAVGAPYLDENGDDCGAVYMFRWDGNQWNEEANFKPGSTSDRVGFSVAADGAWAVAGAPRDDERNTNAGAVYVYRFRSYVGWTEEQKLMASDGAASDYLGTSVSIHGNTIVAGAPRHDHQGTDSGASYVFTYQGGSWVESQELLAPDGQSDDRFGHSVAASGDGIVAGAQKHNHGSGDAGAAYSFRFDGSGWTFEQELLSSDRATGDYFGDSVALAGKLMIVGASRDDDSGADSGSAYIFRYCDECGCWLEDIRILASDRDDDDNFGSRTATDGVHAITWSSDLYWNVGPHRPGTAYIHDVRESVLALAPTEVDPGDTLTVEAYSGPALTPVMLTAVAFDGTPLFKPLLVAVYGPNCDFVIAPTIGPEWTGHTVTMEAWELGTCGSVVCSEPVTLTFQ